MANDSTNVSRPSLISWGVALAAVSLITIGGGLLVWNNQQQPSPEPIPERTPEIRMVQTRILPLPAEGNERVALHSVAYTVENGTPVVKIRVVATGDELIVDANTGRLLETRPSRPTATPPMGRFAAPFAPMT